MKYKNIIFIEDNQTKFEEISEYLQVFGVNITRKESFSSGLREIFSNDYDLLLLDMSLPIRDDVYTSSNYLHLGGHKILSELKRKNKSINTILITMYAEFSTGNTMLKIEDIDELFKTQFEDGYVDYVYYSSHREDWKEKLKNLFMSI